MTSTNSTFSWEDSARTFHNSSIASVSIGIAATVAGVTVSLWYFRNRHTPLRTAINDAMICCILLGSAGAANAFASGLIRLLAPTAMQSYCDVSALLVQMFTMPSLIALAVYFISVIHEIKFGRNDFDRVSKLLGMCVAFGVVSSAAMFSATPYHSEWGCRMSPTDQPWCYLPVQQVNGELQVDFFVGSIILAQVWYLVDVITGALCVYYVRRSWRQVMGPKAPLPLIFYARCLYVVYYLVVWLTAEFTNMFPAMSISEALLAPSPPLIDALIFYWSEHALVTLAPGDKAAEQLIDAPAPGGPDSATLALLSVNRVITTLHQARKQQRAPPEARTEATIRYDEEMQQWLVDGDDGDLPTALAEFLATLSTPNMTKKALSWLLCFLAGYCDCCGFLTMDLFTAHVTGNFCTIGTALANGIGSTKLKVAALGAYCGTVLVAKQILDRSSFAARFMFLLQSALLLFSWIFAKSLGFAEGSLGSYLTGLTMVAGMAVQNVFQRSFLVGLPMTTLMTGNTTTVFVDIASWRSSADARLRVVNNAIAIVAFLCGCAVVTVFKVYAVQWIFYPPPLVCLLAVSLSWRELAPKAK